MIVVFVLLLAFSTLSSAYYYSYNRGYADDYDRFTYSSQRENRNGIKSTYYDRTTEEYWNGYQWVERTVYVRENRETPYYGYGYGYQPSYNNNYYRYPYYNNNNYRYGSYNPYW